MSVGIVDGTSGAAAATAITAELELGLRYTSDRQGTVPFNIPGLRNTKSIISSVFVNTDGTNDTQVTVPSNAIGYLVIAPSGNSEPIRVHRAAATDANDEYFKYLHLSHFSTVPADIRLWSDNAINNIQVLFF